MEETSYHTPRKELTSSAGRYNELLGDCCRKNQQQTGNTDRDMYPESVFGQHLSVFNSVDGSNLVTVDSVNGLWVSPSPGF